MCDIYNRLLSLCNQKGVTGAQMCRECGISKSLMSDLKYGRRDSIAAETATKIANYFNVSVDFVLTGIKKEAPTLSGEGSSAYEKFNLLDEADKAYISGQIDALLSKRK